MDSVEVSIHRLHRIPISTQQKFLHPYRGWCARPGNAKFASTVLSNLTKISLKSDYTLNGLYIPCKFGDQATIHRFPNFQLYPMSSSSSCNGSLRQSGLNLACTSPATSSSPRDLPPRSRKHDFLGDLHCLLGHPAVVDAGAIWMISTSSSRAIAKHTSSTGMQPSAIWMISIASSRVTAISWSSM